MHYDIHTYIICIFKFITLINGIQNYTTYTCYKLCT